MISSFEATLIGILEYQPITRYEVMKAIQSQSLYWAGSPGAVYSALGRLSKKGMIREIEDTKPKIYEVTPLGLQKGIEFLNTPVSAAKLVLTPDLIRMKLLGLQKRSEAERVTFYRAQLEEYAKADDLLRSKSVASMRIKIGKGLTELAAAQLRLEAEFIEALLSEIEDP